VDGGYRAFADLLRRDGYRLAGSDGPIAVGSLARMDIFVVVNATTPRTAPAGSDPGGRAGAAAAAVLAVPDDSGAHQR
jgi:hypothetical protein